MLQHVSISIQIILRELVVASLKYGYSIQSNSHLHTERNTYCSPTHISTQNAIRTAVQLTSPHRTPYIHTKRMLPHCYNGPFIF
jgi:hypothetical protein